jgi:hypothetical protein
MVVRTAENDVARSKRIETFRFVDKASHSHHRSRKPDCGDRVTHDIDLVTPCDGIGPCRKMQAVQVCFVDSVCIDKDESRRADPG